MKKFVLLFALFSFLFSLNEALAYTQADIANAQFLSDEGIIVKQSATAEYRLDDTITRAEVVGIALKIKGTILPEKYTCKNYFLDVVYNPTNNWICRAVELGADQSIITRVNTKFRPQDTITRAEGLGILYKTKYGTPPSGAPILPFVDAYEGWIGDVVIHAYLLGIIDNKKDNHFYPNRAATRAEVFSFAAKIIEMHKKNMELANDLGWGYSKDAHNVYHDGVVIPGMDAQTFQLYENEYMSDGSGFYKYFTDRNKVHGDDFKKIPYLIPNIDKNSFTIVKSTHVKDSNSVYYCNTFSNNGIQESKCIELMADAATFVCQGINDTQCEDKDSYFNQFGEKTKK